MIIVQGSFDSASFELHNPLDHRHAEYKPHLSHVAKSEHATN